MIKNFLETKTGRNFLIGVTVFFVVVLGLTSYSLFSNTANREETTKKGQTEETAESKERLGEYSATTYSGKWYSNRSDEMVLELKTDGTYRASSWLAAGKYYLVDNGYLVLEDKEEIYFYPNEEVKVKMEEEITEQAEAAQQVISQAWLDVLQQGAWENTNTDRTFTLEFKDGKLIQKKIEEDKTVNELTYDYRVVTVNPDQDGAVFVITKIDDNGRKEEVSFSIGEKGSKYALRGDPGSFNWITIYEKEYEAVSPTQDGTTREEATKKNV
ncbi:hypothetical protein [Enterococcus hirae]|uniref:hypothetical protein n=1 Tax=Enterococcus hirae TaxID=1354 RepID=UPI0010AC08C2|nr:hypothetical protein [Enterococcus hirae]EMF0227087.1 hypothetical protein [Enterococcus hirae]TJY32332.1 hypothetical protein FCF20_05915 [Enterococcus hirae]